jgi:hypothetical protein
MIFYLTVSKGPQSEPLAIMMSEDCHKLLAELPQAVRLSLAKGVREIADQIEQYETWPQGR